MLNPLEKYELVDDVRIHNEYTPAAAPVSTTFSAICVGDANTELTLVTALVGVPLHELGEMTNADESPDTFTKPAPLTPMVWAVPLMTAMTLGVNDVTDTMLNTPASK